MSALVTKARPPPLLPGSCSMHGGAVGDRGCVVQGEVVEVVVVCKDPGGGPWSGGGAVEVPLEVTFTCDCDGGRRLTTACVPAYTGSSSFTAKLLVPSTAKEVHVSCTLAGEPIRGSPCSVIAVRARTPPRRNAV